MMIIKHTWNYPNVIDEILNSLVVILLQLVVKGVCDDFILKSFVIDRKCLHKLQN